MLFCVVIMEFLHWVTDRKVHATVMDNTMYDVNTIQQSFGTIVYFKEPSNRTEWDLDLTADVCDVQMFCVSSQHVLNPSSDSPFIAFSENL